MYDTLLNTEKYDSCIFCAQFLDDEKLTNVLKLSNQLATYVFYDT